MSRFGTDKLLRKGSTSTARYRDKYVVISQALPLRVVPSDTVMETTHMMSLLTPSLHGHVVRHSTNIGSPFQETLDSLPRRYMLDIPRSASLLKKPILRMRNAAPSEWLAPAVLLLALAIVHHRIKAATNQPSVPDHPLQLSQVSLHSLSHLTCFSLA